MSHYDYLAWFLIFCWIPTIITWLFYWRVLIRYKRVFLICILGSIIFATPWDYWATHSWLWHFSPEHTLGIKLLGLPIEEFVFFITETILYVSLALAIRSHFVRKKS